MTLAEEYDAVHHKPGEDIHLGDVELTLFYDAGVDVRCGSSQRSCLSRHYRCVVVESMTVHVEVMNRVVTKIFFVHIFQICLF